MGLASSVCKKGEIGTTNPVAAQCHRSRAYHQLFSIAERYLGREGPVHRAGGHRYDPGRSVLHRPWHGARVPGGEHHGDPPRHEVQRPGALEHAPQRQRQDVDAVAHGVVHGREDPGVGAGRHALRVGPARLVDRHPRARRAAARHAGAQAAAARRVPHQRAGGRRGGVRAVAVGVPRRHVLAARQVREADVLGVPPRADDLPVAARGVERFAGLAHTFPPFGHGAVPTVVKASRRRPYACNTEVRQSSKDDVS